MQLVVTNVRLLLSAELALLIATPDNLKMKTVFVSQAFMKLELQYAHPVHLNALHVKLLLKSA